jgi:hypothetical protein
MERDSVHFSPYFMKIGVRFDGRVRFDVVEYCVSEGWVRHHVPGAGNRPRVERGRYVTVTQRGVVEPYWR